MSDTIRQVDVMALFGALKTKGEAKLSDFATPISETTDNSTNKTIKEDKTMRLNLNANKSEKNNVQPTAQVNNVMPAAAAPAAEDAQAVEIPMEPKAESKPAPKKSKPKKSAPKAKADTYSVETYTTKKGGTAALLFGFATIEAAEVVAGRMAKSISPTWRYDAERKQKRFALSMGTRYVDVAKDLCAALNAGDKKAADKAIAKSVDIYNGVVETMKATREEKKAERAAKKAEEKPAAKTYTESEVATLLKSVIAGEAKAMDEVKKLMKKAA